MKKPDKVVYWIIHVSILCTFFLVVKYKLAELISIVEWNETELTAPTKKNNRPNTIEIMFGPGVYGNVTVFSDTPYPVIISGNRTQFTNEMVFIEAKGKGKFWGYAHEKISNDELE